MEERRADKKRAEELRKDIRQLMATIEGADALERILKYSQYGLRQEMLEAEAAGKRRPATDLVEE